MEFLGAWIAAAGRDPFLIAVLLAVGTFILEDAAIVTGALLSADGGVPAAFALCGLYIGIVLGDMGLYGLGWLAARNRWVRRQLERRSMLRVGSWLGDRLVMSVITSRFIPGMRLPTYTACGLFGLPFGRFALAVVGIVGVWTIGLFFLIFWLGETVLQSLGPWKWAAGAGLVLLLVFAPRLIARLGRRSRPPSSDTLK